MGSPTPSTWPSWTVPESGTQFCGAGVSVGEGDGVWLGGGVSVGDGDGDDDGDGAGDEQLVSVIESAALAPTP
jgi:hypothetical protein